MFHLASGGRVEKENELLVTLHDIFCSCHCVYEVQMSYINSICRNRKFSHDETHFFFHIVLPRSVLMRTGHRCCYDSMPPSRLSDSFIGNTLETLNIVRPSSHVVGKHNIMG